METIIFIISISRCAELQVNDAILLKTVICAINLVRHTARLDIPLNYKSDIQIDKFPKSKGANAEGQMLEEE
jgi:hypothetical protein